MKTALRVPVSRCTICKSLVQDWESVQSCFFPRAKLTKIYSTTIIIVEFLWPPVLGTEMRSQ